MDGHSERRVVVIGAGHMGATILAALHEGRPGTPLAVVEPDPQRARPLAERTGAEALDVYKPEPGDLVIIAIPPQAFDGFVQAQPPRAFTDALVVSVMAGVPLDRLASGLGTPRVVRVMPNMAAQIREGVSVVCPASDVPQADRDLVRAALTAIGEVVTIDDESLLDVATALNGGGPAFAAYLLEPFLGYAIDAGFAEDQAQAMVYQIFLGTVDMLKRTGQSPADLYRSVATPGGTTAQGIDVLEGQNLQATVDSALRAAADRAKQLSRPADQHLPSA
ncbi:pyrroline-5-carboxylate reductase [Kitasatospora griseola]